MTIDDLDDLFDDGRADVEARFRELEREAELERMRGGAPGRSAPAPDRSSGPRDGGRSAGDDPLADMKAALDPDRPPERYVLARCPHCQAKNRVSLTRLRTGEPRCGGCKGDLSFT